MDSSIYEAMVRMAQDFSLNCPLVDGHGNFGNLDGDSAAAMRYCVTGDTLINTNKGLLRIEDIVEDTKLNTDNEIDIKVKSMDSKRNNATKLFNSGIHDIYEITLDNGMFIKGTDNHPLLILNKEFKTEWKTIKDLKEKDICIIDIDMKNALYGQCNDLNTLKRNKSVDTIHFLYSKNVMKGTKEYQKKYLKLLFKDITVIKSDKIPQVIYYNKDNEFLKTIQIILATQFGIYSNTSITNKLIIENNDILFLSKNIGIFHNKDINEILYYHNYSYYEKSYEFIHIKSIKKIKREVVYSIKVNSKCHSFIGNGFINHNTEARLSKISEELIDGIKDGIVKFKPNFDESEKEPAILPARFMNLLVNGSSGIAVGLTSSIPTHNLKEINDAFISFLKKEPTLEEKSKGKKNPLTTEKLLQLIKGPDFPTGGTIVNQKDLLEIYKTGEGKILIRGNIKEEIENGKTLLIITEIPYTYSGRKIKLIENIAELVLNKKIDEINEVRDESTNDIRIVLELKKGVDVEKVKNKLYKFSSLQDTLSVRLVAIFENEIKTFSLLEYFNIFKDYQHEIYKEEYKIKKEKTEERIEILEGLIKSYDYIDIIIDIIRHSANIAIATECLKKGKTDGIKFINKKNENIAKKFNFTSLQAENILSTTLRKLNSLELTSIQDKLKENKNNLETYNLILNDEKELNKIIILRLNKISKDFGTNRKTKLGDIDIIEYKEEKKTIDLNLIYDKYGYIKIFDDNTYSKLEENVLENNKLNIKTNSDDNLWCFSSNGNLYQAKLNSISFNKLKDRGVMIDNIVGKKTEGEIIYTINQNNCNKLLFVTKKGYIKIVDKNEFITNRNITIASKLNKDDEIINIINLTLEDLKNDIIIATNTSYLRFNISEVSEQKKNSVGIVSIKTDNEVCFSEVLTNDKKTITINGKQINVSSIKKQKRTGKGIILK